jgi:hypothetical protein
LILWSIFLVDDLVIFKIQVFRLTLLYRYTLYMFAQLNWLVDRSE